LTILVVLARILFYYSSFRIILAEEGEPALLRNTYIWAYSYNVALSSKGALGIFQIGSMLDLAIHVKLAAEQMNLPRAQTQKNWTKALVCVFSLPLLPLGVFNGKILADISLAPQRLTRARLIFYNYFPPTIFSVLSIGLTVACTCLMVRMYKYFPQNLKDEACRIKTIFLVFTVTYLTRATAIFVIPRLHVSYLAENLIFDLGDIFWEVLPLTLIMVYHY